MGEENIFSGLKVVDMASFIAGPGATTILGEFGADVVKVEPPGLGDAYRSLYAVPPHPQCDVNYAWHVTNRNKRDLALNLKSKQAREIVKRLAEWADVFVTNYPAPVRRRLKVTYEDVAPLNERLIVSSVFGIMTFPGQGPNGAAAALFDRNVVGGMISAARSAVVRNSRRSKSAPLAPTSPNPRSFKLSLTLAARAMFVLMPPGCTQVALTLAPDMSSSSRSVSVNPRTANFAEL